MENAKDAKEFTILKIREHQELLEQAAEWFHQKWKIPKTAYIESMEECCNNLSPVPEWYIIMQEDTIIAGVGVIENDFHERKDLTPNLCALYVEKEYRQQGIAGHLLTYVCNDFKEKGMDTLYLITDHTSFYERYGWNFLCMVQEEGGSQTRMYIHKA